MKRVSCISFAFTAAFFISSCTSPTPPAEPTDAIAFVNVHVVPMDSERVIRNQTVVVEHGRITSIAEASTSTIPANATTIDGDGHYLIPALCDMHVHLEGDAWNMVLPPEARFPEASLDFEDLLFPYLANGVTTVQIMSALPEHVSLRAKIEDGEILGPRLLLSRLIDGPERAWPPPISTWVGSAEEARQAVLDAHQTGYDRIKVYSFLDREAYEAIHTTARELAMGVGGHIPEALSLEAVLAAGQDLIAHSEEVMKHAHGDFSAENIDRMARLIAESDTWVTPTLTTSRNILAVFDDFEGELGRPEIRYLHPMARGMWSFINDYLYQSMPQEHRVAVRQGFDGFQRPVTLALHEAGAKLMTGTDALIPSTVPGFSVHDELAELVDAGLTPYDALRTSTTNPFDFLGEQEEGGTIEVGKRAELVLLHANPLNEISNTRQIRGVMIRGEWLSEGKIQEGLDGLAARHAVDRTDAHPLD